MSQLRPAFARLRYRLRRQAAAAGPLGVTGLVLILAAAVLHLVNLQTATARLDELQQKAARVRAQAAEPAPPESRPAVERVAFFYAAFPQADKLPDVLQAIVMAAEAQSVRLDRGEYHTVADDSGRLTQYHMTFPIRGAYPQIRKFINDVLVALPTSALEAIQFERGKLSDPTVDAKVRLVVYLGRPQ